MKTMRKPTLNSLGLGSVIDIFKNGKMPVTTGELVEKVFGPENDRGSLVISGGNGIVGSGKAMQLGARLQPFGVPIVTIDLPDAPDGIGQQYPGLKGSFGAKGASDIMSNIIKFNYDGSSLPDKLKHFNPKFVLEAIPEILNLKKSHYSMIRESFPDIEIRSVTSGFPKAELGVGILHPSFPHQINKIWEVVEDEPSDITKMLWAMGLIPVMVGDYWSFILDVLFCGITLTAVKYHEVTNMPYWKIDKFVRKYVGPNPVRAHDAIGPGASFLTWSCLHHLTDKYGDVFDPPEDLVRRKISGENWYSSNRPSLDWDLPDEEEFKNWIIGPLYQMTSLMLHENRADLAHMNAIGELCAQFTNGILAMMRADGQEKVIQRVEAYHKLAPAAAKDAWYPDSFANMDSPEWQQLYVNAEHDGNVGVVTISRESLNWDVVTELNKSIDWLKNEGIENVILTGDFHLSTQLVGADTTEFYAALEDEYVGFTLSKAWSETARRFHNEFKVSVGFVNGKRCLGGMIELFMHCHYLIAEENAQLGMPEVTLPVVPGMEGCHWALRKVKVSDRGKVIEMLLTGKSVKAGKATGWLVDFAGSFDAALQKAWDVASGKGDGLPLQPVEQGAFDISIEAPSIDPSGNPSIEAGRKAIMDCMKASCGVTLSEALEVQAKHSAGFMLDKACQRGVIGSNYYKVMKI